MFCALIYLGSFGAFSRVARGVAAFVTEAPPADCQIDDSCAFWDTQLPARILTSRASLRHPYYKSGPSGYRFEAASPKVGATLRRETGLQAMMRKRQNSRNCRHFQPAQRMR